MGELIARPLAETTTARREISTPRRVLLNANPEADAVALGSDGERHRRQTNSSIGEHRTAHRGGGGLWLSGEGSLRRLFTITAQFVTQILAQLLEEVRQILVDFVRFDPRVFQRVQDLLHERFRLRRILRRCDETGRRVRCRSRCVSRGLGGRRGTS